MRATRCGAVWGDGTQQERRPFISHFMGRSRRLYLYRGGLRASDLRLWRQLPLVRLEVTRICLHSFVVV